MIEQYIPIILVLVIAAIFGITVVASSKLFGPQRPNTIKESPYESGMPPVGAATE